MRLVGALWPLLVFGAFGVAAPASAQRQPLEVVVELPQCDAAPFDWAELVTALELELAQDGVRTRLRPRAATEGATAVLSLAVDCDPAATSATIALIAGDGTRVERSMTLTDLEPRARPRAVALAMAELARVAWPLLSESRAAAPPTAASAAPPTAAFTEPAAPPAPPDVANAGAPPAPPAPVPAPSQGPPAASPPPPAPVHEASSPGGTLSASAEMRVFAPPVTFVWGARIGGFMRPLLLQADLLLGKRDHDLGSVSMTLASFGAGVPVLTLERPDWRFRVVPRAAVGVAVATGQANEGADGTGHQDWYADGAVGLSFCLPLGESFRFAAGAETGYARGFVVKAGDEEIASLAGWFAGATVGVER